MFSFFLTKPQGIDKDAIEVQSRARRNLKRIDNGWEAERRSKGKKRAAILFRMQTCWLADCCLLAILVPSRDSLLRGWMGKKAQTEKSLPTKEKNMTLWGNWQFYCIFIFILFLFCLLLGFNLFVVVVEVEQMTRSAAGVVSVRNSVWEPKRIHGRLTLSKGRLESDWQPLAETHEPRQPVDRYLLCNPESWRSSWMQLFMLSRKESIETVRIYRQLAINVEEYSILYSDSTLIKRTLLVPEWF